MSDAIEAHLTAQVSEELINIGVSNASVMILSAEAEDWRIRVQRDGRAFEAGFNHRDQLWACEVTPGFERGLVSNDQPRVGTSIEARHAAIRLIRRAILHPKSVVRDPPVI